jgi:Raf kinase inhibitor-like YbhB/YbcL family protein
MNKKYTTRILLAGAISLFGLIPCAASAAAEVPAGRDVMANVASFLQWNTPFDIHVEGRKLPVKGEMVNAAFLVPVRAAFEALGAVVTWDEDRQTWHAEKDGLSVTQRLGADTATVNGATVQLDHAAVLEKGSMMAPARLLPTVLGAELRWNSADRVLFVAQARSSGGLSVHTEAFRPDGDIPVKYAHGGVAGGKNVSLPVSWEGAPKDTKSFAVVMYDVNPIADSYVHWSVLNLPASANHLDEAASGRLPQGLELNPYYGMEPPRYSGDHLYRIAVYALDVEKLAVPEQAPVFFDQLEPELKAHLLAYAETDGFFRQ